MLIIVIALKIGFIAFMPNKIPFSFDFGMKYWLNLDMFCDFHPYALKYYRNGHRSLIIFRIKEELWMNYSNENLRGTCLIIIKIILQGKWLNFLYAKYNNFFGLWKVWRLLSSYRDAVGKDKDETLSHPHSWRVHMQFHHVSHTFDVTNFAIIFFFLLLL